MTSVSEPLQRFLLERLPSIEQIEIVLLLHADNARAWSAPEVSQRLGTPPESTAMRLFLLASNGVVAMESAGIPRYRFAPDFAPLVDELAARWAEDRHSVAAAVGTTISPDPLRSFADAFKLKK